MFIKNLRSSLIAAVAGCAVALVVVTGAMAIVPPDILRSTKMEATIFSFNGEDFVRTQTTLTADGRSAANTMLDRDSAVYKALAQKRSYSGSVTLFGQDYEGHYAPVTGEDGTLTGALFVGVPK